MKYSAIITAGGTSSRFGNTNKLLEKIYIAEQNYLTSYNSRRFQEYIKEQNS